MSSLRVGTPSRVIEPRRPDALAWAANPPNAANFSEALDSATNAPAVMQPSQGERDKTSTDGRSTAAAAARVSPPASVLIDTAGAEDAVPKRVGVNAEPAGRDSSRSPGGPAALLDPGRPHRTLLSQATAQRGGTAPPSAHRLDEVSSQPGRETSGQAEPTAVEDAASRRAAVNAESPGRNPASFRGGTVRPLDLARPQTTRLLQATAQPGEATPLLAPTPDQATSQARREPSGQEADCHASLSATGSASDPAEGSRGYNTGISLITTPASRNPSDSARELFDKGVKPEPVGLQTAYDPSTRRSDAAARNPDTASAATLNGHRPDRNRPTAQTGAIDTALGLMSAMSPPALPDSNNVSLPSADQGDDRRLDHMGVGSISGSERRGEAGVARLSDDAGNLSAANKPNADPSAQRAVTRQQRAIDAPTGLDSGSAGASHEHASSSSAATVTPVAERPTTTMASSDGLVVATSPAQGSVIAAPDPSIANAAAVAGSTPNTAVGGLLAENSPSASVATPLPANLPDQLLSGVIGSIQSPGREIVLRLDPPGLGNLTVRVMVSGHEVTAWFATPQVQLQQVIGQAIGQLHTDLSNAGYTLSGAWVGADASNPRDRGASLPLPARERSAATGVEPETPRAAEIVSSSSGVSIYV